ncbi:MAG: hypothetical protein GC136_03930 [Alphaproteobacteria bacterium]|nr:hypothetical protein [Alphaproteobacteria bacterium]
MNRALFILTFVPVLALLAACNNYFGNGYNWMPRGYMPHQELREENRVHTSPWDDQSKYREERSAAVQEQWDVMSADALAWLQSRGLALEQTLFLQPLSRAHERTGLNNEFELFMGEKLVDAGYYIGTDKTKSLTLNYEIREATPAALQEVSKGTLMKADHIKKPYAPYIVRLSLTDSAGRLLAERMGVYALVKQYE